MIVAGSIGTMISTDAGGSLIDLSNEAAASRDKVDAWGNDTILGVTQGPAIVSAGAGANVTVDAGGGSTTFVNNDGSAVMMGGSGALIREAWPVRRTLGPV